MVKENCPILLVYYGNSDFYSREVVLDILPALKEVGFNKIALDEIKGRENIELLNHYAMHSLSALLSKDTGMWHDAEKNFAISTYNILKKAKDLDFSLHSIDMKDVDAFLKLKKQSHESYHRFYSMIKDSKDSAINDLFTNVEKISKISIKEMGGIFSDQKYLTKFVDLILEDKFIRSRNKLFAENIEKLCSEKDGGVIVFLRDLHTQVSNILINKDYKVNSYWITKVVTPESLVAYHYKEFFPGIFNNSKDLSTATDREEAIEIIKTDTGYYSLDEYL